MKFRFPICVFPITLSKMWSKLNWTCIISFVFLILRSPDGTCILTCSDDNMLRLFNLPIELYSDFNTCDILPEMVSFQAVCLFLCQSSKPMCYNLKFCNLNFVCRVQFLEWGKEKQFMTTIGILICPLMTLTHVGKLIGIKVHILRINTI
jgi:hypothetical protein